jgi:hypothetical protein
MNVRQVSSTFSRRLIRVPCFVLLAAHTQHPVSGHASSGLLVLRAINSSCVYRDVTVLNRLRSRSSARERERELQGYNNVLLAMAVRKSWYITYVCVCMCNMPDDYRTIYLKCVFFDLKSVFLQIQPKSK